MKPLAWLVLGGAIGLAACQTLGPAQRLVIDLRARGLPVALGTEFNGVLLGGDGTTVCVGDESVQVYAFLDTDAAIDAAATIDRDDPWSVGNAIVEWIGPPKFWLRDRAIIQYVGRDERVEEALRTLLGQPFADGGDLGGRGPLVGAACERAAA